MFDQLDELDDGYDDGRLGEQCDKEQLKEPGFKLGDCRSSLVGICC